MIPYPPHNLSFLPAQGDEHIRQISLDSSKPQYVIFSHKIESENARTRPSSSSILAPIHTVLSLVNPPPPPPAVLLETFLQKSNAAFPILPPSPGTVGYPAPLLAKVYISALNHLPGGVYRPFVKRVRETLPTSSGNGIHRSSLAAISDALLDVSARPVGDAEELYLILAKVGRYSLRADTPLNERV